MSAQKTKYTKRNLLLHNNAGVLPLGFVDLLHGLAQKMSIIRQGTVVVYDMGSLTAAP